VANTKNIEKSAETPATEGRPVVITTDKRGVFFGYTNKSTEDLLKTRVCEDLQRCRMCIYWSTGGIFSLAENGPTKNCRISARTPSFGVNLITGVMEMTPEAVKAWEAAKTWGT
jgi:hypothetical protein